VAGDRAKRPSYEELASLVAVQAKTIDGLTATNWPRLRRSSDWRLASASSSVASARTPATRAPPVARSGSRAPAPGRRTGQGFCRQPKAQPGQATWHEGTSLQMSANPDEIVDHRPECCGGCGEAFAEAADRGYDARQVVDLPEVRPIITEHRAHTYGCACGHETTAAFPDNVRAPVSYGREQEPSSPTCSVASTSRTAGWLRPWRSCSGSGSRPGPSMPSTQKRVAA